MKCHLQLGYQYKARKCCVCALTKPFFTSIKKAGKIFFFFKFTFIATLLSFVNNGNKCFTIGHYFVGPTNNDGPIDTSSGGPQIALSQNGGP